MLVWQRRDPPQAERETAEDEAQADVTAASSTPSLPEVTSPEPLLVEQMDWQALARAVSECTACALHERRRQSVFGTGDQQADWMIIGEAPGEQEDLQGEPFVGRAGVLLTNMLFSLGLSRDQVYIANVIKCRPPGNRNPEPAEIDACIAYLDRQVQLIQPTIILVVGKVAAQALLNTDTFIGQLRGRVYRYPRRDIPMVVTYHPAYLLRKPLEKRKAWADLQLALKTFRHEVSL